MTPFRAISICGCTKYILILWMYRKYVLTDGGGLAISGVFFFQNTQWTHLRLVVHKFKTIEGHNGAWMIHSYQGFSPMLFLHIIGKNLSHNTNNNPRLCCSLFGYTGLLETWQQEHKYDYKNISYLLTPCKQHSIQMASRSRK